MRFLPSYSPDFNPIELAFAKIKQNLRGAAARTFAGLVAATGPALEAVTAADARGFFAHCGYPLRPTLMNDALIRRFPLSCLRRAGYPLDGG